MKKTWTSLLIILTLIFLAVAIYYWVTKAGSLPHWAPGYAVGSTHVHFKHGLAALILAILSGIGAWFVSGSKDSAKPTSQKNIPTE